MSIFDALFGKRKRKSSSAPDAKLPHPPILIRLSKLNKQGCVVTLEGKEMLGGGWYRNNMNPLVRPIDTLIRKVYDQVEKVRGCVNTESIGLTLSDGVQFHACQVQFDPLVMSPNPVHMVLYIGADDPDLDFCKDKALYGSITPELISVFHHVSIRLNAKLLSVNTSPKGDVIALFKNHDPNFNLKGYFDDYFGHQPLEPRGVQHGSVHRTDGPVEGS